MRTGPTRTPPSTLPCKAELVRFEPKHRFRVRAGPDGIHLFNRDTGWNLLVDEARVPPSMWSSAPRQVSVALTNACDLHCRYCYAPKHPAMLDADRLIKWLEELDAGGCLGVGFGGGEPTLHREFAGLCLHAARRTGMAVTLTTHAHRIDSRLASDLSGNVHFVRVSMDGVARTYEELRGRSFDQLLSRLETIRQIAPFGINFVVNASTISELDAAVGIAAEAGAREFLLLPEQRVRGNGGIDRRTTRRLRLWVKQYRGHLPLSVSQEGAVGLPTKDPLEKETGLRGYAHIDASGVLRASSFAEFGVPIGDAGVIPAVKELQGPARRMP